MKNWFQCSIKHAAYVTIVHYSATYARKLRHKNLPNAENQNSAGPPLWLRKFLISTSTSTFCMLMKWKQLHQQWKFTKSGNGEKVSRRHRRTKKPTFGWCGSEAGLWKFLKVRRYPTQKNWKKHLKFKTTLVPSRESFVKTRVFNLTLSTSCYKMWKVSVASITLHSINFKMI